MRLHLNLGLNLSLSGSQRVGLRLINDALDDGLFLLSQTFGEIFVKSRLFVLESYAERG